LIDQKLQGVAKEWAHPIQLWAIYKRLQVTALVIELGFALKIYELYEIPIMYWYVYGDCDMASSVPS
jgi:hypothetical protein